MIHLSLQGDQPFRLNIDQLTEGLDHRLKARETFGNGDARSACLGTRL
jgi:hypothetical protein